MVNVKTLKRLRKEGQLCYDETTLGIKILFPTVSDDQCCDVTVLSYYRALYCGTTMRK